MSFPEYKPSAQEGSNEDLGRSGIREKPKATEDSKKRHEELQDLRTEEHQESLSMLEKYREKIFGAKKESSSSTPKNKFTRMVVIALGLHAPLVPEVRQVVESIVHQGEQQEFKRAKMEIHPQSMDVMLKVEGRKAARAGKTDPAKVNGFKEEARQRIERGETLSLKDEYLELERLNGMDASAVDHARQAVDQRIEKYGGELDPHHEIDPQFLKQFVAEMYGPDANYEWGQASVTTYFNTGKRNCVSIAKSEAMVMEGVLQKLDPEIRSQYELGIKKIKQHEIATLTYHAADGKTTGFELEGNVKTTDGGAEQVGSKVIPIEQLKKSMVAEKPVVVAAKKGTVAESPDLITVSDQPVDDGIRIEGDLVGSDFVIQEAKREGVEPQEVKEVLLEKPIELELLNEDSTIEDAKKAKDSLAGTSYVYAEDLHNPSPEAVAALELTEEQKSDFEQRTGRAHGNWVEGIRVGDMRDWSAAAIGRALFLKYPDFRISVTTDGDKAFNPLVLDEMEGIGQSAGLPFKRISLEVEPLPEQVAHHPSPELFRKFLGTVDGKVDMIGVDFADLSPDELAALHAVKKSRMDLSRVTMVPMNDGNPEHRVVVTTPSADSWKAIQSFGQNKTNTFIRADWYLGELKQHPDILKFKTLWPKMDYIPAEAVQDFVNELSRHNEQHAKDIIEDMHL
ncbi:MAG: hypothetical protein WA001_03285 [Patescibacteria group bacterium]